MTSGTVFQMAEAAPQNQKSFEVLPRMPFGYKSTLLYAPTAWSQLFNTTCNWIGARTKFFKY